ncbi:hypothetical protein DV738_g273, partial [Chaetothyriales sp. CBS 135597]
MSVVITIVNNTGKYALPSPESGIAVTPPPPSLFTGSSDLGFLDDERKLTPLPGMARAEDGDPNFASGADDDDDVHGQSNGDSEAVHELAHRLQEFSSQEIRTSDREELIQCIKRGQRPTWVPKPNLKALCAETNAQSHSLLHRAKDDASTSSNGQPLAQLPASGPGFPNTLPEPIPRPPSALHSGDFDAQPPLADHLPQSPSNSHQLGAAFHGIYSSSPPWLKLDHHLPRYSNGGSNEVDAASAFDLRAHSRSRAPSLGSSLSSSFVMRAPTSPLVHATNSPVSERAETLMSEDGATIVDRNTRRRTMPTHTLVQISSLVSAPSSPPPVGYNYSSPFRSHQGRRSLSSFTYQPASSSQAIFPSRQRRLSHTPDASPRNHTSMIGSFEESILRGRMSTPPSKPLDFVAQIGVLGKGDCPAKLKCPAHVSVPFPAVFYKYPTSTNMRTLSDDSPSPYVGTIDLSANLKPVEAPVRLKRKPQSSNPDRFVDQIPEQTDTSGDNHPTPIGGAYRVPQHGQVQVIIQNPNKTAVKLFLIPYDLGGMTAGTKTFVRQRSLSSGPVVEKALSTDPERTVLDPLSNKQIVRYLIHLKFCCLAKGRFYLHDNIRVVFANRVPEGKERLRNEIQLPEPRYSVFVPGLSLRRQSLAGVGLAAGSPSGQDNFSNLDDVRHHPVDSQTPLVLYRNSEQSHRRQTQLSESNAGSASSQSDRPQSPEFYGFDKASTSPRGSGGLLPSLGQSLSRASSPAPAAAGDGLLSRKLRELSRQKSREDEPNLQSSWRDEAYCLAMDERRVLTSRGYLTLEEALDTQSDVLPTLTSLQQTLAFRRDLEVRRPQIEDLVSRHLNIASTKFVLSQPSDWIYGGFNICLPIEILDTLSGRVPQKALLRIAIPHAIGESFAPGAVDEKVRCEAATYVWLERECPTIPTPRLLGMGFPGSRSFARIETQSWLNWTIWHIRRATLWFQGHTLPGFFAYDRAALPDLGYLLIEYVQDGAMLSSSWHKHRDDPQKRKNLYSSLASIMLNLSLVPLPRIGSWTMDNNGSISLTNRPFHDLTAFWNRHHIPLGMPRDLTYSSAQSYIQDLLAYQDARMQHQANSILNRDDGIYQLSALVGLCATIPRLFNTSLSRGRFVMNFTDLHQSNMFVDNDWNITRIIDLEFAYSCPAELVHVPHWLSGRGVDELDGPEQEELKTLYDQFVDTVAEQEIASQQNHTLSQRLREDWTSGRIWYFKDWKFESHAWPLAQLWSENVSEFLEAKVQGMQDYNHKVRQVFAEVAESQNRIGRCVPVAAFPALAAQALVSDPSGSRPTMHKISNITGQARHGWERMAPAGFGGVSSRMHHDMGGPQPMRRPPPLPAMSMSGQPGQTGVDPLPVNLSFNMPFSYNLAGPDKDDILHASPGALQRWTFPPGTPDDQPSHKLPVHVQNEERLRTLCQCLSDQTGGRVQAAVSSTEPKTGPVSHRKSRSLVTTVCISGDAELVYKIRARVLNETPIMMYTGTDIFLLKPKASAFESSDGLASGTDSGLDQRYRINIFGDMESVEHAKTRALMMIDQILKHKIDVIKLDITVHTLVSGRTGKSIKLIESATKTAIYFPPPFPKVFGYVPPNATRRAPDEVFITGETQERINQAKQKLKELVLGIKLYSKDAIVSASKIDAILLDRLDKVRKIMEVNGSYVMFPPLGGQRGLVRVQGTDVLHVERTVKEIMALAGQFYSASWWLMMADPTQGTAIRAPSKDDIRVMLGDICANSGADLSFDRFTFSINGSDDSVKAAMMVIHQIPWVKTTPYQMRVKIELANEHKEFVSGKKNGKINKIMGQSNVQIIFDGFNEYNFYIDVVGSQYEATKNGLDLVEQEMPASISFHVPDQYHKRIIGIGGQHIQRIMKKYSVFVKFSNAMDRGRLGKEDDDVKVDNVICRTPARNAQSLDLVKQEIMDMVEKVDAEFVSETVLINRLYHRELITRLPEIEELEKKWNCKIDFPSTEQASDVVVISGPEYQVPQAVDAFLGMVPESHEISFQKSPELEAFLQSPEFVSELRQKLRDQYEVDAHLNPQLNSLPKSATASVERLVSAGEGRLVLAYTRNNAGGLKDAIDWLIEQLVPHGLDASTIKGAIPRPISDSFADSLPFFDSRLFQKPASLHTDSPTRSLFGDGDNTPVSERASLFDRLRKPGSIGSFSSFMSRKNQNNSPGTFFKQPSSNASKASLISMESRESGYRNFWNDSGLNLAEEELGSGGWPARFSDPKFPFGSHLPPISTPGDRTPKHEPRASFESKQLTDWLEGYGTPASEMFDDTRRGSLVNECVESIARTSTPGTDGPQNCEGEPISRVQLFSYTNGRFLMDEEYQISRRYAAFNVDELWNDLIALGTARVQLGIWNLSHGESRAVRGPHFGSQEEHLRLLTAAQNVLSTLAPFLQKFSIPVLWHPDLHMGNVFVSEEDYTQVVGIIDWQFSTILPTLIQAQWPRLLTIPDNYETGPNVPQMPANVDEMNEEEQKMARQKYEEEFLAKCYEIALNRANHEAGSALSESPEAIRQLFLLCPDTYKDGIVPLRECLIKISQSWEASGFPGSCPIQFTSDELSLHQEQLGEYEDWRSLRQYTFDLLSTDEEGWVPPQLTFEAIRAYERKLFQLYMDSQEPGVTEERAKAPCKFSHQPSPEGGGNRPSKERRLPRPDETDQQKRAKADYHSWKRIIKTQPRPNDERTVEQLWNGALAILNGDERESKQMVPRDLDNQEYFGREHILLTMQTSAGGYSAFTRGIRPFLLVITHPSFLDCLSVDTSVGGLYNFIGGTNGNRAIPFLQQLCEILVMTYFDMVSSAAAATVETGLVAMSTALRELLRRESRARFNDDLPILIDSMENAAQVITGDDLSETATIVFGHIGELRAMVARAKGLLAQEEEQHGPLPTITLTSTYPRDLVMPGDRHDNDKADMTKIKIFPTTEEILSDEADFLPSTDVDQPHFLTDRAERHIDTYFRLLRHDIFGELKDILGGLMHAVQNDPTNPRLNFGDFRANEYRDANISHVSFDKRRGLGINISFAQPSVVRKKSTPERRKWWEESKRLAEGVLLSFISIEDGKVQHLFFTVTERNTDTSKDHSLTKNNQQGTITAKLTSHDQMSVESAVCLSCQKARGVLIEFPGVLPATFIPILENLQDMQQQSRLPFRQWILPDRVSDIQEAGQANVPPPLYARKPSFTFSLEPLLKPDRPHNEGISINPTLSGKDPSIVDQMEARTSLDRGQCQALLAALTREFAFIQGPPGTGKSYLGIQLMRVLMHCKMKVDLGPVVVVYPRIHAQFGQIDEEGFEAVGRHPFEQWAPSRRTFNKSGSNEETQLTANELDQILEKAETNVQSLSQKERRKLVEFWSQEIHVHALDDLFEGVKGSDSIQQQLTKIHDEVDRRVLQNADVIGITTTGLARRISTLKRVRCKVVICEEAGEVMEPHMISALLPTIEHFIQIGDHEQLRPQINNYSLSLESKQGALYQLDRSQFERLSVGERGRQRIPVAQLNVQRRMRPEISTLIRETIYPRLGDHQSTINLPDVVGMRKNVFWLEHDHLEVGQASQMQHKSHSNIWEVEMVHALVRHIVRQGAYGSSDIAVLTPYTGQLQRLRSAMRNDFEIVLSDRDQDALEKDGFTVGATSSENEEADKQSGQRKAPLEKKKLSELLRIATVDNFQGEEAKVIIVSLVRSNKERRVGFLRTKNRINVLLSRAQHGMYLIGNADTYSNIPMWQKVIAMLRASGSIGNSLGLCCQRHKETPIEVSKPDDFASFPVATSKMGFYATELRTLVPSIAMLWSQNWSPDAIIRWKWRAPLIRLQIDSDVPRLVQQYFLVATPVLCGMKQDARVDLLEMKTYAEVDVNESPIVVLGCGHFFTAESLDGLVGLQDVYVTNKLGQFSGLADISGTLASKIPQCPDCQCPIRQYVTQRYNRVINRAVIDEMSKRFLVNGKTELRRLELQVDELEKELEKSRSDAARSFIPAENRHLAVLAANDLNQIQTRYNASGELNKEISSFLRKVADRHQPAQKLHEAQIHAIKANRSKSLDEALASLSIQETIPPVERDRRITLGGRLVQIKAKCIVLEDKFSIAALSSETPKLPSGSAGKATQRFLQNCATFIRDCNTESLPKLAVEASLYFARVTRLYQSSGLSDNSSDGKATEYVNEARDFLEKAIELCKQPFQNAEQLKMAAEESIKLLGREWYEKVTAEELASIKQAMMQRESRWLPGQTVQTKDGRQGIVRYIGTLQIASGDWVGLELPDNSGKNDGSVKGERYFTCPPGHGIFVRKESVVQIARKESVAPRESAVRPVNGGPVRPRPSTVNPADARKRQSLMSAAARGGVSRLSAISPTKLSAVSSSASSPRSGTPATTARTSDSSTKSRMSTVGGGRTSMAPPPAPTKHTARPSSVVSSRPSSAARSSISTTKPLLRSAPKPPVAAPQVGEAEPEEVESEQQHEEPEHIADGAASTQERPPQLEEPETHSDSATEPVTALSALSAEPAEPPRPLRSNSISSRSSRAPIIPTTLESRTADRREVETLKAKIRTLEKKALESRDRLKGVDALQAEKDRFATIIQTLQKKLKANSDEMAGLRAKYAEAEKRANQAPTGPDVSAELESQLELANIDREMAEEKAAMHEAELEALKARHEELELEMEILREENKELSGEMSPEERSSAGWIQLEKECERLRHALLLLRDHSQDLEADLRGQIKELEHNLDETGTVASKYEATAEKLLRMEEANRHLIERLETAEASDEIVLALQAEREQRDGIIEQLQKQIQDYEEHVQVADELELFHVEEEKKLHSALDESEAVIHEQDRRAKEQDKAIGDLEYTLTKFRDVVQGLQTDIESMRRDRDISELQAHEMSSKSKAMMDLNLKLQSSAAKTQLKTIDYEIGRMQAEQAVKQLEIVELFAHDGYDRMPVLGLLCFKRIKAKATLVKNVLADRIRERPHLVQDDPFVVYEAMEKMASIALCCDRFVQFIETCSPDELARCSGASIELEPVERSVTGWIEALKRDELGSDSPEYLQRMVGILDDLADKLIVDGNESKATGLISDAALVEISMESTASQLSSISKAVQGRLGAPNDEDEESLVFDKSMAQFGTKARTIKYLTGKVTQQLSDLRARSMCVGEGSWTAFEEARLAAEQVSSLIRALGKAVIADITNVDVQEASTYSTIMAVMTATAQGYLNQHSPRAAAPSDDIFALLSSQLQSVQAKVEDLQKDRVIEELKIKVDVLQSRQKDSKERESESRMLKEQLAALQAEKAEFEAKLQETEQRYEEVSKKRETEKAELDSIKAAVADGNVGAAAGAELGQNNEMAAFLKVQVDMLNGEIISLQSAVRHLKQENYALRVPVGEAALREERNSWLDPSSLAPKMRGRRPERERMRREAADLLDGLIDLATTAAAKPLTIALLPARLKTVRQREEVEKWLMWKQEVIKRGRMFDRQRTAVKGVVTAAGAVPITVKKNVDDDNGEAGEVVIVPSSP